MDAKKKPTETDILMFESYNGPWKGKRYYICQSNIGLWMSLSPESTQAMIEQRHMTREEDMAAARRYPYKTNGCRCKWCRYRRLYKKVG